MSEDYDLFVQITSLAYSKPRGDDDSSDSTAFSRWRVRYHVLRSWVIAPGFDADGAFSESSFEEWLEGAQREAEELGILEDLEREIGRNLFHAPQANNGFFLPEAMASFIESSESALDGFAMEAFNSRGMHFIDPTGKQEDEIADSYEKKAASAEERGYARFAARLRSIAKAYRQEAEENRNDE